MRQARQSQHQGRQDQNDEQAKIDSELAIETVKNARFRKLTSQEIKNPRELTEIMLIMVVKLMRRHVIKPHVSVHMRVVDGEGHAVIQNIRNSSVHRSSIDQGTWVPE